jgi:PAS domain S-box-containing protein
MGKMSKKENSSFLNSIGSQNLMGDLFDSLPEVYFFAKDVRGRFVRMNRELVKALGLREEAEVLGKTDFDFFTPELADRYRREDQMVMDAGQPIHNQIWQVPTVTGVINWYLASKIPLRDRKGKICGVAGAMRDIRSAGAALAPYESMRPLLNHIRQNLSESIPVADLAALAGQSTGQLERRWRQLFGLSPSQYILKARLDEACTLLIRTSSSISEIAHATGFYDHSYFIRQFRKRLGQTPSQYRKKSRKS